MAEAKAQLNVKESTKDAELNSSFAKGKEDRQAFERFTLTLCGWNIPKPFIDQPTVDLGRCAHCAARIVIGDLSSATAAVCDVRSSCRPGDVISAPSPEVVITSLPRKSSIPKNSGDEKLDPTAKPSICSHSEEVRIQSNASESNVTSGTEDASVMSFTTEVRRVLPPQKDFSAVGLPLTEGGSEEEDVDWRATHLHADSLMCFELKWPVPDWNAADAPKEVRISGSFWGWQQPRAMNRSEDGYSIQLEMPLEHEDHHGVGEERMTNGATTLKYTRSDPGRRSPIRQKMQYHEFKFLVDGQWRCADHYEKKRTEDGAFENNVVYF
ncbi:unnamed protein product [Toxocara canis]|uniref:AMP-activated protein kinase glycogen-binding domain-containing protein n=1 Tax=Toxocara canis TaxID=6265 RepID=A0A3P7ITH0_TOXCA|nr:unnamed protein product [Toxocara canis]